MQRLYDLKQLFQEYGISDFGIRVYAVFLISFFVRIYEVGSPVGFSFFFFFIIHTVDLRKTTQNVNYFVPKRKIKTCIMPMLIIIGLTVFHPHLVTAQEPR